MLLMEPQTVDNSQSHRAGLYCRSNDVLLPHNEFILKCMKVVATLLLSFYFVIPAAIWFYPGIIINFTYLNYYRWPLYPNFSETHECGINYTRNYFILSQDNSSLGTWHILPQELGRSFHPVELTNDRFIASLDDGLPIFLYMHGSCGNRAGSNRVDLYKKLTEAGYHVIAFDYRGFGDSTGSPSEDGMVTDAMSVYYWVKQHSGNSPIFIWGHSLGTGVATSASAKLISQGANISGLILESPFNNYLEAALSFPISRIFEFMPWYNWIFVNSIKQNKIVFASDQHIKHVTAPILIIHAEDDETIPFELGRKLYAAAKYGPHGDTVEFVRYDESHGYGHTRTNQAPDLVHKLKSFVSKQK